MGWFRNLGSDRPWAQGCVIAASGVVLSLGSCFGLLFTLDFNGGGSSWGQGFSLLVGIVLGLSVLAVPVGVIWFIIGLVKNASKDRTPPAPPAPRSEPPVAGAPE